MMVCNAYSTFSAGEVTHLLVPHPVTVSSVHWPPKQQEHTAEQKLAYLHPKRPQAGNSQGYSQLPSPQTGSTQVGVSILSPMYASTSSLLEKVVVIPPSAKQTRLECAAMFCEHDVQCSASVLIILGSAATVQVSRPTLCETRSTAATKTAWSGVNYRLQQFVLSQEVQTAVPSLAACIAV